MDDADVGFSACSPDGELAPRAKLVSSFFFIPMWVFPIVFVAIGLLLLAINIPTALAEAGSHRLL